MESDVWFVFRLNGGQPTKEHRSEADAKREAERLARAHRGERFYVCQAVAFVQATDVTWQRIEHSPPF